MLKTYPSSLNLSELIVMEEQMYEESMKIAKDAFRRFPLKNVKGVPLMEAIVQNWESVCTFCPDPSDLLMAAYPKAGKTQRRNNGWGEIAS